jgi:hypothetical protein
MIVESSREKVSEVELPAKVLQLGADNVQRNRIPNNVGCSRISHAKQSQVQDNGCVKHKNTVCNILLMMLIACSVVHSVFFNN